ncbi:hypothetical protein PT015_19860 [Candidatus Mycobacterium wuenschmannii]|uniref:Uncharacterized protein n=1 Tax=Candidatus Mycobacterium wuenschmannii TaxID=3027808 RepID=A0ABY8W012_9MYCO|nr:hypothetical protein [Candidatus Mycobacterium wuenschmannii]WIM87099.1 hypothetical protein PT015_19860 [Candidatus Mycobacterium wuenschmannii]
MTDALVRVRVDRESVHPGDDTESHQEIWDFPSHATLDDLLVNLCAGFLASVAGDIMWTVYSERGSRSVPAQLLAVIYVDHPSGRTRFTRVWSGDQELAVLRDLYGSQAELTIFVAYPSGGRRLRLATLDEIKQSPFVTGAIPVRTPMPR